MPNIGLPEMLIVLVIALLVLGPKKLPEAGRSLGKGMREFKDSLSGFSSRDDDLDDGTGLPALEEETTVTAASTPSTPASTTSEPSQQS